MPASARKSEFKASVAGTSKPWLRAGCCSEEARLGGMPSSCLDGRQGRMYKAVWLFKSLHMIMFTVSWNKLLYFDITMMS